MNIHQSPKDFYDIESEMYGAERAIIARCMATPDIIPQIVSSVSPRDFDDEFLAKCFSVILDLNDAGRKPSLESLVVFFGDDELKPGVTVRDFLTKLLRGSLYSQFLPVEDAIAVLKDNTCRKKMAAIGDSLVSASRAPRAVLPAISEIATEFDELSASLRQTTRRSFDGEGIANAAFAHLDSSERSAPTTGLADLDRVLGGWPKGELSVLAGRPGMGKSAVATTALTRAAKARHGCLFFSLEMTAKQIGARILADLAFTRDNPIFYEDILKRQIDARQRERLTQAKAIVAQYPFIIEEQRGLTISDIMARSRKVAAQYDRDGGELGVVFVDHMLLVRASQRYAGNRVREVAEISDGLASLAKDLNVAVVALCQLNRGVEGRDVKRPTLSDLRDSGAIEEDASTVTFIYRPAYYLEQTKAEGEAERKRQEALEASRNSLEFIVAKNRNGRVGIVDAFVNIGANAVRDKAYGGF